MNHLCTKSYRQGFTLTETLITIVLLGILAVGVMQVFAGTRAAALERDAVEKAHILNTAKQTYKLRKGAVGFAGTDEQKYALLQPYIPMAPSTLSAFAPQGYSYGMGNINAQVTITGPDGAVSY
jgi:prepilin-type N-terminal cleavage/methylation domain-containing protein